MDNVEERMNVSEPEKERMNVSGPEKEQMGAAGPEKEQMGAAGPEEENRGLSRDFHRGICFGILLSVTLVLIGVLFRYGTIRFGKKSGGAGRIASAETVRKLTKLSELIEDSYLYEVDPDEMETWMFKGVAAGLNDRYADYYSEEELREVVRQNEGSYHGLGIVLTMEKEGAPLVIASVYENSPAMEAGLQADDVLVKVGDDSVEGMTPSEASELIRNWEGDEVPLSVVRGQETLTVRVSQAEIEMAPVKGEMLEEGIGYIVIPEFDMTAATRFAEEIQSLQEQGMEGLIIDLRDNPGGVLDSVCTMLDDLLPEGLIVSTSTKNGKEREIFSDENLLYEGPAVLLMNEGSASASEVFAGAFQDYELGPVVGVTSYGKGVVQRTYTLSDGSAFKLTTEKYYTALGRDIDGVGIEPDVEVSEKEEQLPRAVEELKARMQNDGQG